MHANNKKILSGTKNEVLSPNSVCVCANLNFLNGNEHYQDELMKKKNYKSFIKIRQNAG